MKRISILVLAVFLGITAVYAHSGVEHSAHRKTKQVKENFGICPVTQEPASQKYSHLYEGTTYYFCCPMCVDQFKKDPKKYMSKIKEIKVEAFQFGFSPDPIKVKKGDIVKLSITSRDVTHGFYLEKYGINVQVKKGEVKNVQFVADKPGEFMIECSVYCGPGHEEMKGRLIVEE